MGLRRLDSLGETEIHEHIIFTLGFAFNPNVPFILFRRTLQISRELGDRAIEAQVHVNDLLAYRKQLSRLYIPYFLFLPPPPPHRPPSIEPQI